MESLANKIYTALNGNFPKRENSDPLRKLSSGDYNHYYVGIEPINLEPLVRLPVEANQATVEGLPGRHGEYSIEYTEEGKEALVDAYSRKFSEGGEMWGSSRLLFIPGDIAEGVEPRFLKYKDRIITGLQESYFDVEGDFDHLRAALHNVAVISEKIGIDHARDCDFMQTFWTKIRESPYPRLEGRECNMVVDYVLEPAEMMSIGFEFDGLAINWSTFDGTSLEGIKREAFRSTLYNILSHTPMRTDIDPRLNEQAIDSIKRQASSNLPKEVYRPILESVERVMMG